MEEKFCTFCGKEYVSDFKRYTIRRGVESSEIFVCPDCLDKIKKLREVDKKLWTKEDALNLKKMAKSTVKTVGKMGLVVFTTLLNFGLWLIKQGLKVESEWSEVFGQKDVEGASGYEVVDDTGMETFSSDEGLGGLVGELFEEEPPFRWEELVEESESIE